MLQLWTGESASRCNQFLFCCDCLNFISLFSGRVIVFVNHEFIGIEIRSEVFCIDERGAERDESTDGSLNGFRRGTEDKDAFASDDELIEEEDGREERRESAGEREGGESRGGGWERDGGRSRERQRRDRRGR